MLRLTASVLLMSTMVAAFLMSALFPPDDRGLVQALVAMVPHDASVTIHTALWIGCATLLYQFERTELPVPTAP